MSNDGSIVENMDLSHIHLAVYIKLCGRALHGKALYGEAHQSLELHSGELHTLALNGIALLQSLSERRAPKWIAAW